LFLQLKGVIRVKSILIIPLLVVLASISLSLHTMNVDAAEIEPTVENKAIEEKIKEKWDQFDKDIQVKQGQIGEIDQHAQQVSIEIKQLDEEVALINEKIRNLEPIINTTKEELNDLKYEISSLEGRIEKREKVIRKRLRNIQVRGGEISYLEVFLGVKSFADFLETSGVVNTILDADKQILELQTKDQQEKIAKDQELRGKLASLDENLKEAESLRISLQEKIEEKNKLMKSLNEQKLQIESEVLELYEVYDLLSSQEIAILKEYEKKKVELAQLKTDEFFTKPTTSVLTSGFGLRWETFHAGVDLADSLADVIVMASASGTVIRSYYSTSYGNCVFITHNINDKVYTTVYAHLENRMVTTGQTVIQGQIIGYMGNTGHSFGKHLHFEIHEGPWNINKTNSVDPTLLVDF
jgi:murein DD-endopeptidase MepM/ murein hydrolase activator NlpD